MRSQRHDPYPWTWEPAAATLCVLGLLTLIATRAGQTLAARILGHPAPDTIYDPVRVLDSLSHSPHQEQAIIIACIILAELVALTITGVAAYHVANRSGAIGPRGFATPTQARRSLGQRRLRRQRRIIRPDLTRQRVPRVLTPWSDAPAMPGPVGVRCAPAHPPCSLSTPQSQDTGSVPGRRSRAQPDREACG